MKYTRTDYRRVIELLDVMPEIQQIIGFKQLPHFTTIHKFLQRFGRYHFDKLLLHTINLFATGNCILAIDGTGYSTNCASLYYSMKIERKTSRKMFLQSIITVDTDILLIASQHSRKGPGNENSFFMPLVKRASRHLSITHVVADRGYDCEANHEFVNDKIGAKSIIPVKDYPGKIHGYYRKKLKKRFNKKIYHKRSLAETVFSMIKRRFGSILQSRSLAQQNREAGLINRRYNQGA